MALDVVEQKLASYPDLPQQRLRQVRTLIEEIASAESLGPVEASLKWGEASFLVRGGSPIRVDWKARSPGHYYLYFHCQTKLLDTFRELYTEQLQFEGNRAVRLSLDDAPVQEVLRHCLTLAMTYHRIKHLPLLGC